MSRRAAASGEAARPEARKPRWLLRVALGLLGLFMTFLAVALSTLMFGSVQGREFSPDTFQRRRYLYYEIPLLRLQAYPIRRSDDTGELDSYLAKQPFMKMKTSGKPRWDLIQDLRAPGRVREGDAAILCAYLDARDADGELVWLKWTKKRPQLARLLWSAVADVARQELYIFIPELIRLAEAARDPAQLRIGLNEVLAERFRWLAETQQRLGDHKAAFRSFTAALQRTPGRPRLLRGRAKSFEALAATQRAAEGGVEAAQQTPDGG